MNIAGSAIDRRALPVQVTRAVPSTFDLDGKSVPATPVVSTIKAVVQPASGRQLMDLPEGIRSEANWLIWSRSEIRLADEIASGGLNYRVRYLWPRAEGAFYRAAMGLLRP